MSHAGALRCAMAASPLRSRQRTTPNRRIFRENANEPPPRPARPVARLLRRRQRCRAGATGPAGGLGAGKDARRGADRRRQEGRRDHLLGRRHPARDQRRAHRGVPQALRAAELVPGELSAHRDRRARHPGRAGDQRQPRHHRRRRRRLAALGVRARGGRRRARLRFARIQVFRRRVQAWARQARRVRLQRRLPVRADVEHRPAQVRRQVVERRRQRRSGRPHEHRRRREVGRLSRRPMPASARCSTRTISRASPR